MVNDIHSAQNREGEQPNPSIISCLRTSKLSLMYSNKTNVFICGIKKTRVQTGLFIYLIKFLTMQNGQ